jgi:uncharacterized membrane-anchored protein
MHERALGVPAVPARIRQWLVLLANQDERDRLDQWEMAVTGRAAALGRITIESAGAMTIWEAHGEFSTVTEIRMGERADELIGGSELFGDLPGAVFRSIEIYLGAPGEDTPAAIGGFRPDRLVSCHLFGGAARMWSDYSLNDEGTGFIRIQNIALANDEPSRLVQTLIEVGNYRKLALLGFPVARTLLPWLAGAEARHLAIASQLTSPDADVGQLLSDLVALSAEVDQKSAEVRFRMGATFSYDRLTRDRLAALRESRIAGFSTAGEFIERRMLPAMRTCAVADRRLTDLSERINRTASLISLEQTVSLGRQNMEILAALDQRAGIQLRLQGMVEGLSVFALCYYAIGLLGYLLGLFPDDVRHGVLAVVTPPALLLAWLLIKRMKRRVHRHADENRPKVAA